MIYVRVMLKDANCAGPVRELAAVAITNDGSASDGSGDSPTGNYNVVASWEYKDGRKREGSARVEGFDRKKSALALVQLAIESLALGQRERRERGR